MVVVGPIRRGGRGDDGIVVVRTHFPRVNKSIGVHGLTSCWVLSSTSWWHKCAIVLSPSLNGEIYQQ